MKTLIIDIESFSHVDLSKSGTYRYSESEDFDILLFGYSADGQPVQVIDLASGETMPGEIRSALKDPSVIKWAFNAQFERVCLSRFLGLPAGHYLDPSSWRCTMVWAAYLGLPLSLDGVGTVLGLEKQKLNKGWGLPQCKAIGKRLTAYCRARAIEVRPCETNDERFGKVNSYPLTAWEAFLEEAA